ncbi:SGNH/GDSL hydrolase family protein [Paraburkholderia sp. J67]|uniref:SGNH/GDSL hydrolase family protein n=1 Tax=Paraburkholderia sp. J67 TaxID=2805435 RepID=UPI0039F51C06
MPTVLCFGDSNTFGTKPMSNRDSTERWDYSLRWPGVLQQHLGGAWRVIEEGLPGRTISLDDPVEGDDRNALRYLPACLQSHRPLDVVVFMLGTNDCKARFGRDARGIAESANGLIDCVLQHTLPVQVPPWILLVCPPVINEVGCLADVFYGANAKSSELRIHMQKVAASRGVSFLYAGLVAKMSAIEGIHLDAKGHEAIGREVAEKIRSFPVG